MKIVWLGILILLCGCGRFEVSSNGSDPAANDLAAPVNDTPADEPTTCDPGYTLANGRCYINQQVCTTGNGTGLQSFVDGSYGACEITQCAPGFSLNNGTCQKVCTAGAPCEISHCLVHAQTCPNQNVWDHLIIPDDSYNGSAANVNACLARADDYRGWCGLGPNIFVGAYDANWNLIASTNSNGYTIPTVTGGPAADGSNPNPVALATQTFSVDSYGAVADGVTDSTAAFQAAINAAMASGQASRVSLSAGTYLLNCPGADQACLSLATAHQLTFSGQGVDKTLVLIGNPRAGGFGVSGADNVYFSDFSLDYKTIPATQGTVIYIGQGSVNVQIDGGFPLPNNTTVFPGGLSSAGDAFGMVFDPYGNIRTPNAIFGMSYASLGGNTFTIYGVSGSYYIGDKFVYPVRNYQPTFAITNSSNVGLKNVTQYAGADVALQFVNISGSVVVNNFQLKRRAGRVLTASGGAIWARNNTARFLIENSYFEGMGDDLLDWHAGVDKGLSADWAAPGSPCKKTSRRS